MPNSRRVDILLVEHDTGDARLITDALAETDVTPGVSHVRDGVEAMLFLRREAPFADAPRPRIILLDLNLPGMDGRAVLRAVKSDPSLAFTPIIVFSGSDAPNDIITCYAAGANCYIVKPRDRHGFTETFRSLVDFWCKRVTLSPA